MGDRVVARDVDRRAFILPTSRSCYIRAARANGQNGANTMKIEIEITDEDAAALRVLGHDRHSRDGCEPHETLRDLLERIHDGVYRPGSWERGVLLQLFGDLWLAAMERDPEVEWRQRPKARFRR